MIYNNPIEQNIVLNCIIDTTIMRHFLKFLAIKYFYSFYRILNLSSSIISHFITSELASKIS